MSKLVVDSIDNAQSKRGVPDRSRAAESRKDRSVRQIDDDLNQVANSANVSIHFDVDDETNRVIVIVSERESGRVIRTIPASELQKMQAGDLLKMTA